MIMADAVYSDVVILLEELSTEQTARVVEQLKEKGLEVSSVDDDRSVVEGTIEAGKAHDLKSVPSVRYIRTVFTYEANFPPGDPRDRDGQ
jgi:hypothetical protein